jgi:DNA-binding XRE family transcriptional regulator
MEKARGSGRPSRLVQELRDRPRLPSPATARAILLAAGAQQAAVAEELGVHRVTVTRWLNGARRPRGETAVAYALLLRELAKVGQ